MANVQEMTIEEIKSDFFGLMETICIDDMDEPALEQYQQRHSQDEGQDEEAA